VENENLHERKNYQQKETFRKKFFGKFYNIVVYIRASFSRTKEFKDLAEKVILFDNNIRWNN
jgi:hypothetical protein